MNMRETDVAPADGDWFAKDDPRDCLVTRRSSEWSTIRPVARQITLQQNTVSQITAHCGRKTTFITSLFSATDYIDPQKKHRDGY